MKWMWEVSKWKIFVYIILIKFKSSVVLTPKIVCKTWVPFEKRNQKGAWIVVLDQEGK